MITGTYQFLLQNNILVRTKKTYNSIYLLIQNVKSLNNMHYYNWIQVMNTGALSRVLVCVFQLKSTQVFNCIYLLLFMKFSYYAWNKWKKFITSSQRHEKISGQSPAPSHNSYVWILYISFKQNKSKRLDSKSSLLDLFCLKKCLTICYCYELGNFQQEIVLALQR